MADFNPGDLDVLPPSADDFLQGVHLPDDADKENTPEVRLYRAVVARAWGDAFGESWIIGARPHEWIDVRAEARRWLVLDHSGWKADREEVCVIAGIDPDHLRDAARTKLAAVKIAEAEKRRKVETFEIDLAFSILLDGAEDMGVVALDAALADLAGRELVLA